MAQAVDPTCRVVYVDNDPVVLTHARALLTSAPGGATAYIEADVREPGQILADPQLRGTLDLDRPVALMLLAVMHFVEDDERPYEVVAELVDALPAGSYLVMSHATPDFYTPEELAHAATNRTTRQHGTFRPRTRDEFARHFAGHELVPPGITPTAQWRAETEEQPRPTARDVGAYCAVARIGTGGS